jgi:hypothetical protein
MGSSSLPRAPIVSIGARLGQHLARRGEEALGLDLLQDAADVVRTRAGLGKQALASELDDVALRACGDERGGVCHHDVPGRRDRIGQLAHGGLA